MIIIDPLDNCNEQCIIMFFEVKTLFDNENLNTLQSV